MINDLTKYIKPATLTLAGLVIGWNSHFYNDSGVSTRVQQPLIGVKWVKEEGHYFKLPFVSRTRSYNQKGTVAVTDNEDLSDAASVVDMPRNLQFADSYSMRIEYSLRYEIAKDDETLEQMHRGVKSENNLLNNTLMPFALTLVADTAAQVEAGNFTQGGRNEFRNLMSDQAQGGMFVTRVEKAPIVSEQADHESGRDAGKTKEAVQYVRKVVYVESADGTKARKPLSISEYGIKVVSNSINIIEAVPQNRLVKYIENKQSNIQKQIAQEEQQKLLREKAKTTQLQGAEELIKRTNALNIDKASAIIAAEKRVAEAKLQAEKESVERQKVADLAIIDKTRELQVAEANEGIQKANAVAAKHQANALKEVGFAKAAVQKAHLAAKQSNKEIYLAELNRDVNLAKFKAMKSFKVEMPDYVSFGGGEGSGVNQSLAEMSNMVVLDKLESKVANK